SNCFVSPDGSVKVGDFGLSVSTLAKEDSYLTATGVIMGTPAYAAPEQLRGDNLDLRADIYSVGATLFTLLTNRAPFEGDNAVQVVANAVNQKPKPLTEFRDDVSPGLERVMARCLAKEADGRYGDYPALRNALLPFSSRVPEPASMKLRASAGWIDYLSAFLVPYVALMLSVGAVEFHVLPFIDRTLYAARFHIIVYCLGFLYFAIVEGIWGAGIGKRLKGLRVVRTDGGRPGFVRAFIRILTPILCIEVLRVPFLLATLSARDMSEWTGTQALLHIGVSNVVPWIAVLLTLQARRENGFATAWDRITGTRVVVTPKGTVRGAVEQTVSVGEEGHAQSLGPYRVTNALIPDRWLVGSDPVLRRPVWLLRRTAGGPSSERRSLARQGRLRWLQKVEGGDATWDAFEATPGMPFSRIVANGATVPWSRLRHWLYDLASELWAATGDHTLPAVLSLDHVWITAQGQAMLLDDPWPDVETPTDGISVSELDGQQRFLSAIAACVESTSLPLHARGVLQNLASAKFEKLSFLTGILRGLQDRPAEVNRGIRAGSLFMMPAYVCTMSCVGYYQDEVVQAWGGLVAEPLLFCIMVVLGIFALVQLCEFPFRTIVSHAIYRLAVIDAKGERAGIGKLYLRWVIVWLPLLLPLACAGLLLREERLTPAFFVALIALLLWISAAVYAVIHPNRGLHDRLAGTWVVRR
ncbi:MAG: RDD family protein, partial [Nitrospirales bacterium]